MDKWRTRIGWISPRRLIDLEAYEFYQVAPKDVMLVSTHLGVRNSTDIDECRASFALIEAAAETLIAVRVDIIIPLGAPVLLIEGVEGHRLLLERLQTKSNIPVTTGSQAVLDVFKHLRVKRIMMVVTWPSEKPHPLNAWKTFLTEGGMEIADVKHVQHGFLSIEKGLITPSQVYEQVKAGVSENPDIDAVYVQCGALRLLGSLEAWEEEIGKPVVSTGSAHIWGSFRPFNITVGCGYGRVLESLG